MYPGKEGGLAPTMPAENDKTVTGTKAKSRHVAKG